MEREPGWQRDVLGVFALALFVSAVTLLGYWLGESTALQRCEGVTSG